jgi:hypothetical protein
VSVNEGPRYLQLRHFEKALNADVLKKSVARGTTPPWIKSYVGQLDDDEYSMLNLGERGFLQDLRLYAARRGNKIPNDERTLKRLFGYSPNTRLVPKLTRLRTLRFLEEYSPATNIAANQLNPSHPRLEPSETHSRLEVEVEDKSTSLTQDSRRATTRPTTTVANPTRLAETLIRNGGYDLTDFSLDDELVRLAVPETDRPRLRELAKTLRSAAT